MNKMWKTKDKIKAALIQMSATPDKEENVAKALRLTCRAIDKKAQLIILPECFYFRGAISRQPSGKRCAVHRQECTFQDRDIQYLSGCWSYQKEECDPACMDEFEVRGHHRS